MPNSQERGKVKTELHPRSGAPELLFAGTRRRQPPCRRSGKLAPVKNALRDIDPKDYRLNPFNQGETAPKVTDITTPGNSYELPAPWIEWIEEYGINGRVKKP